MAGRAFCPLGRRMDSLSFGAGSCAASSSWPSVASSWSPSWRVRSYRHDGAVLAGIGGVLPAVRCRRVRRGVLADLAKPVPAALGADVHVRAIAAFEEGRGSDEVRGQVEAEADAGVLDAHGPNQNNPHTNNNKTTTTKDLADDV